MTIDFGTPTDSYSVSGIRAYPAGLQYRGAFYAGEGETVTLGLSGASEYAVNAGTLTETDGVWTLVMPNEDVVISLASLPVFGTPDFTLPAALVTIEESAFEGLTAMTVVDASHCASIGANAFKDCTGLTQIRLPADCTIAATAFSGCGTVYVYAPAGGATEDYCQSNDNPCVFVEESQN